MSTDDTLILPLAYLAGVMHGTYSIPLSQPFHAVFMTNKAGEKSYFFRCVRYILENLMCDHNKLLQNKSMFLLLKYTRKLLARPHLTTDGLACQL